MKWKPLWKHLQPVPVFKYCIIYIAEMLKDLIISRPGPSKKWDFFFFFTNGPMKTLFKIFTRCVQDLCIRSCKDQGSGSILADSQGTESAATDEIWAAAWTKKAREAFSIQIPNSFGGQILNFELTQSQCRKSQDALEIWKSAVFFSLSYGFRVLTGDYCHVLQFFLCNCGG